MEKTLNFVCPQCGGKGLELIEVNATVTSLITEISIDPNMPEDSSLTYGTPSIDECTQDRIQCTNCNFILTHDINEVANELMKQSQNK